MLYLYGECVVISLYAVLMEKNDNCYNSYDTFSSPKDKIANYIRFPVLQTNDKEFDEI